MHLDKRLHIVWRPNESDESLMSLNSFMHQLDSVSILLKKKEQCDQISSRQHHETNLLELQCNSDSNMKEDDLLNIFKYQVLSVENLRVYVSVHESQNKCGCDCFSHAVLN